MLNAVRTHAKQSPFPFTTCGTGHVNSLALDVSPNPPVKGANVTIDVSGLVDEVRV
jgi:hypothetical protein